MLHLTYVLALTALAPRPDDSGIYTVRADGDGPRTRRNDGAEVVLVRQVARGFGAATLQSQANDNSLFYVQLRNAGPLAEGANQSPLALLIDGVCVGVLTHSDRRADGTIDLGGTVYGEAAAARIAAYLKVEPERRKHPGHRFEVRWSPEKDRYSVGESVMLKMEIRNAGDRPLAFVVGGKQRGPRDNQYRFLAYRSGGHGKAVPDTGDPLNFGGIGSVRTLQPGETFTASVDLGKWFNFTDPDIYRVTGIFEMAIQDPARADWRPIWEDLAVGECFVRVVARQ
jgi:hypothetical protein